MSKKDEQIARMMGLMTYGMVTEEKKPRDIEYSIDAADGKTYSIIRENSKYYIKTAPKGQGLVLEAYSFIGGWNNHKDYEYDSYNNALKQLELKVRSVNEACGDNSKVEVLNPDKKEDILAEASDSMKKELARFRELMNNVSSIMNESAISDSNTGNPEAPKTTSFSSKLGEPFNQTATAELDTDLKKTANDPEKQSDPFGDNEKAEGYKDAQYVPDNSVANKKPSGGKVEKVNEEFEETFEDCNCDCNGKACNDWASNGIDGIGVGSPDGHLMEDDDFDNPVGFSKDDNNVVEGEEDLDDAESIDDLELDDIDSEEDIDDSDEELELDDIDSDDESNDDDVEDELSSLRKEIEDLKNEIAELKGEDSEEDIDIDDDELNGDDIDLEDEESFDDELDIDDVNESTSKKKYLDRIVEAVTSSITGKMVDGASQGKLPSTRQVTLSNDNSTFSRTPSSERLESMFNFLMKSLTKEGGYDERFEDTDYKSPTFRKMIKTGKNFSITEEEKEDFVESFNDIIMLYREVFGTENGEGLATHVPQLEYYPLSASYTNNDVTSNAVEMDSVPEKGNVSDNDPQYINVNGSYFEKSYDVDIEYWDEILDGAERICREVSNKVSEMNKLRSAQNLEPIYENILNFFNAIYQSIDTKYDEFMMKYDNNSDDIDDDEDAPEVETYNDNEGFEGDDISDEEANDAAYRNAEKIEKNNMGESKRRNGKSLNEEETILHDFGKHPGYRKKPMSLPQTGSDTEGQNRDWNDESVYSEQPFGEKIGTSDPFETVVQKTVQAVMEQLKKKL